MAAKRRQISYLRMGRRSIPLSVRRHPRAHSITVRIDNHIRGVTLVLPRRTPLAEGLAFVEEKSEWILKRLDALPQRIAFQHGAVIPVLGQDHVIRHLPDARSGVWRGDGAIYVSGFAEHLARRVTDFLKAEARLEISERAREKAALIEERVRRITLRDTSTRWGSCTSNGDLAFSWRLILAPEEVLDYVVAHEVAHLRYMNHGKRFWSLTRKLTDEMDGPRDWLRDYGDNLLFYG